MKDKKAIRQEIKIAKQTLTTDMRIEAEKEILNLLLQNEHIKKCHNIALYYSLPDELPTHNIINKFITMGYNIFLPVITEKDIVFKKYDSSIKLQNEEKFGIAEPTSTPLLPLDEPFIVITPGIAFTTDGIRLGRGGGYYDRFFYHCKQLNCNIYKIGIAYKCQKRQMLPNETFDVKMDCVYFA